MANDFVQTMIDARVDARSLSDFMFYPASEMITRRLAPSIHTLNYYLDYFNGLEALYSQESGTVTVNGVEIKTVRQAMSDAIDDVLLGEYQEGMRADLNAQKLDTGITAVAKFGGVERELSDKISDTINLKDFYAGDWDEAFEKAFASGRRIELPEGEIVINRGIKIPSNTKMYGAGIDKTIIKVSDSFVKGESNIYNETTEGNTSIHIGRFTLDGNVQRYPDPFEGGSGGSRDSGITFRGVVKGSILAVRTVNTVNHGIDITCGSLDYPYVGDTLVEAANPSKYITIKDCDTSFYGDDGITTHHSENLFIIDNYSHDSRVLTNNNGIEIDDGSRNVYISGNLTERNNSGIEVKAHQNSAAPKNVFINGHVSREDRNGYTFRHIGHHAVTDPYSKTARNIQATNLVCINPNNKKQYYSAEDRPSVLTISAYFGVTINGLIATHNEPEWFDGVPLIAARFKCRDINISNVSVSGFTRASEVIYITGSSAKADNVNISNVVALNSGRKVVAVGSEIDHVNISNISGRFDAGQIVAGYEPICVVYSSVSTINLGAVSNAGYPLSSQIEGYDYRFGVQRLKGGLIAASTSTKGVHSDAAVIASTGGCSATKSKSAVLTSFESYADSEYGAVLSSFRSSTSGTNQNIAVIASAYSQATGAKSAVLCSYGVANPTEYTVVGGNGAVDATTGLGKTSNTKWQLDSKVGTIKATGAVTGSSVFTDYAEYFESLSGQPIASGTLVTLEGDKIRPANSGDVIVGAISETAGVVLGEATWAWQGEYLKNEFGGITDELNPDYVADVDYVSRAERPEWNIVGLMGQLYVRIDESVKVGQGVTANNGIAAIGDTGIVMQIAKPYNKKSGYGVAKLLLK